VLSPRVAAVLDILLPNKNTTRKQLIY
jgi:hypothetical protein